MTNQTKKRSQIDSTVADIHRTRERISDAFGGDITAITEDAKRRQEQSNRRTVSYAEVPNKQPVEKAVEHVSNVLVCESFGHVGNVPHLFQQAVNSWRCRCYEFGW